MGMEGQVLVLNQNYEPLNITSMRRAVTLLHLGKAEVVEVSDADLHSVREAMAAPSVVRLSYFVRRPFPELRVSRKGIFARDDHRCQYCGAQDVPLTLDHVVPTSRGGKNDWLNLVTCCVACNNKKGSRTPLEAGMPLPVTPYRPRYTPYISFPKFVAAVRHQRWYHYLQPFAKGLELAQMHGQEAFVGMQAAG
jgi:5-methylcytosine-specific restriction endonuclease McrA